MELGGRVMFVGKGFTCILPLGFQYAPLADQLIYISWYMDSTRHSVCCNVVPPESAHGLSLF